MSKLTIYGVSISRAFRSLWAAEELGLTYEHVQTHFADGATRSPEFLAINPNGHIPAIVDDGLKLHESMAINLYLARKHDKGLWPKTLADEGLTYQWSFWGVTEMERLVLDILFHRVAYPEDKRKPAIADAAAEAIKTPLGVLEQALQDRPYLLGDSFTIADLNVASIMFYFKLVRFDLAPWPKVKDWFGRCLGREAVARANPRR